MRIIMLTGSYPPEVCGVGDYTRRIRESLIEEIDIKISTSLKWGLLKLRRILHNIKESESDIVHVQYPSNGYGSVLSPFFLWMFLGKTKCVVTLHEFSRLPWKVKILSLFFSGYDHILFTTQMEMNEFCRILPFVRSKSSVVPIGSTIPKVLYGDKESNALVYFGIIAPGKGIEDFIKASTLLRSAEELEEWNVSILGMIQPKYEVYAHLTISSAKKANISVDIALDNHQVAEKIAAAQWAYLPYPDGISERRGSALACFAQETNVITIYGKMTSDELKRCAYGVSSPEEAVKILLGGTNDLSRQKTFHASLYFDKSDWHAISENHIAVYNKVLSK